MAIFLVFSTWKFSIIEHSFNLTSDMTRSSQIMPKKLFFKMMTSSMTSQGSLKFGPLYSFINEITTFFMKTKKRAKISPINSLCVSIMILWLHLYRYTFMIHDVIDDVTRSQSRSNFEINISPSIFELECRSKARIIGNDYGYLSGISNFRYNFLWKSLSRAQNGGRFTNFEISNTASI